MPSIGFVVMTDFANVYHQPMTISVEHCLLSIMFAHIIVSCVLDFSAAGWAHNLLLQIRYEMIRTLLLKRSR